MRFHNVLFCVLLAMTPAAAQKKAKVVTPKEPPKPTSGLLPDGKPFVSAASAIVIDAETGKVLWSKEPDTPRYPASTTKIMTGLLLLEKCKPTDVIKAPSDVENVKEASMHLKPGEKLTAKDMLYALMLRSANDGCYAVACHIAGSVPEFAKLMNERAKQIGCQNTHFNNPNGLNDPTHMTSARDLALIAREAMKRPEFRAVVKTQKQPISRSVNRQDLWMINKNRMLKYDRTVDGIKTGYTNPAGKCFVGSAVRGGYRIITVVMKSEDWAADTKVLLDWGFNGHEWVTYFKPGEVVGTPRVVSGGVTDELALGVTKVGKALVAKGTSWETDYRFELKPNLRAPIIKGQPVGTLVFEDSSGFKQSLPLIAMQDIPVRTSVLATSGGRRDLSFGAIALLLAGGAYMMRRKNAVAIASSRPK